MLLTFQEHECDIKLQTFDFKNPLILEVHYWEKGTNLHLKHVWKGIVDNYNRYKL
jgi:hypothetical protein